MEDQLTKVPEIPPMPQPEQPKKKMSKGKMWLIGIGVFFTFATINNAIDGPGTTTVSHTNTGSNVSQPSDPSVEEVVDYLVVHNHSQFVDFCAGYPALGREQAIAAFESGYGVNQTPSAAVVVDELWSRCP